MECIRSCWLVLFYLFFFFKQKTAYEMRISDWSSDVCSSDLGHAVEQVAEALDIGVVQRRVDLVEDADRRGIGEEQGEDERDRGQRLLEIGRASCRERVCQYV